MARELVKVIDPSKPPVENFLMNGGFHHWQRGFGVAGSEVFGADRWRSTLQTTLVEKAIGTDPFTSKEISYARVHKTGTTGEAGGIMQPIESHIAAKMVGKIVTLHFFIKAEAGSVNDFYPYMLVNTPGAKDDWTVATTTKQSVVAPVVVGSTFGVYTYSFLADADFELGASIYLTGYSATGTATDQFVMGISQAMLHISEGSQEYIPWVPAGVSIEEEERLCKRYYQEVRDYGYGYYNNATMYSSKMLPVTMRSTPTVVQDQIFETNLNTYVSAPATEHYLASITGTTNPGLCRWQYRLELDAELI